MALLANMKNALLILVFLLIVVGLGSLIFTGQDDAYDAQGTISPQKALLQDDNVKLTGDETVTDLLDLMVMRKPSIEFVKAPGFELTSITGEQVSLEQFRGKAVLLGFWATW